MKLIKNDELQEAINNVDGQKFDDEFKGVASVEYADAVNRMQAKRKAAEDMYSKFQSDAVKIVEADENSRNRNVKPTAAQKKLELSESLFTTWLTESDDENNDLDWNDSQDVFSELDYVLSDSRGRNRYPELKKFATYGGSGDRLEVGAGETTRDGKYYDFKILAVDDKRLDYARAVAKLFELPFEAEDYTGRRSYYTRMGHIYLPVEEAELPVDEYFDSHEPLNEVAPIVAGMAAAAAGTVASKVADKILGEDANDIEDDTNLEEPDETISVQMNVTPTDEDRGVAYYLNMLIKDEWEAIQGYQDAIGAITSMTDDQGIVDILNDIEKEENLHVGQLQKAMQLVAPSANDIAKGEEEAEEQLTGSTKAEVVT